jgi:aryl carrier-like protein
VAPTRETPTSGAASSTGQQSLQQLEATVMEIVKELVGADVAPGAPLAAQGLDSLAAMELRQKLQVRCLLSHSFKTPMVILRATLIQRPTQHERTIIQIRHMVGGHPPPLCLPKVSPGGLGL